MLDLAILMLIEVQANDPISTTFHRSSLLIILSEPFKLDNMGESFSTCLQKRIEACKKGHELLCLKEFEKHRKLATLGKCLTEWYNENFKKN